MHLKLYENCQTRLRVAGLTVHSYLQCAGLHVGFKLSRRLGSDGTGPVLYEEVWPPGPMGYEGLV